MSFPYSLLIIKQLHLSNLIIYVYCLKVCKVFFMESNFSYWYEYNFIIHRKTYFLSGSTKLSMNYLYIVFLVCKKYVHNVGTQTMDELI